MLLFHITIIRAKYYVITHVTLYWSCKVLTVNEGKHGMKSILRYF